MNVRFLGSSHRIGFETVFVIGVIFLLIQATDVMAESVIGPVVGGPGGCGWYSYTNDQRAFVEYPGNVFPLPSVEPGTYVILVGPAGPDGLALPPPWFKTYGPYNLGANSKWMAIMGAMSMLDTFRENAAVLLPYSDPGPVATIYVRNRDIMQWNAICVVPADAVPTGTGGGDDDWHGASLELAGTWTAHVPAKNWSHGGYQIIQNGQDLIFVNYLGRRHTGRVLSEDTISVSNDEGNLTGKVSTDGKRIDWSNGSHWTKG